MLFWGPGRAGLDPFFSGPDWQANNDGIITLKWSPRLLIGSQLDKKGCLLGWQPKSLLVACDWSLGMLLSHLWAFISIRVGFLPTLWASSSHFCGHLWVPAKKGVFSTRDSIEGRKKNMENEDGVVSILTLLNFLSHSYSRWVIS